MAARESYFIVISDKSENLTPVVWSKPGQNCTFLNDNWKVFFDPGLGGPGEVVFDTLHDWTKDPDPRIKYYSGTAIYKRNFKIETSDKKTFIDLANPDFVAKVVVNSKEVGVIWCSPWQLEITDYLKDGENTLEIHVANSLINRMVYDASLPEGQRVSYSYPQIMKPEDELIASGLKQVKISRK
jgi:hypothetical protein